MVLTADLESLHLCCSVCFRLAPFLCRMTTSDTRDPRLLLDLPHPVFEHMLGDLIGTVTVDYFSVRENATTLTTTLQSLSSTCKALRQLCHRILCTARGMLTIHACKNEFELQQAAISCACGQDYSKGMDRAALLGLRRRLGASSYRSKRVLRRSQIQFRRHRQTLDTWLLELFAKVFREQEKGLADAWQHNDRLVRRLQVRWSRAQL